MNDQLLAVEDVDLTGLVNKQAMETLRQVMQRLDPTAFSIRLTVARWSSSANGCPQPPSAGLSQALAARVSALRRLHSQQSTNGLSLNDSHILPSPGGSSLTPGTPDGDASLTLETPRPTSGGHFNSEFFYSFCN